MAEEDSRAPPSLVNADDEGTTSMRRRRRRSPRRVAAWPAALSARSLSALYTVPNARPVASILEVDSPLVKMLDFDWPRRLQALDSPTFLTRCNLLVLMLTPPLTSTSLVRQA